MTSLATTSSISTDPSHRATAYASSSAQSPVSTKSATITSSDFLTLLVTQLKSQDPTQPVDPAAYVQQLVGVNSLEQLIDMNAQLKSLTGTLTTGGAVSG